MTSQGRWPGRQLAEAVSSCIGLSHQTPMDSSSSMKSSTAAWERYVPGTLSRSGSTPPPPSQPAVCTACRRPQCFVCPVFDMPKLVGSSWLCCPLETTLLESGPPHWLAMAPGRMVLPSTSLVQVK